MKFIPTIGLEIHAELKTRTKMFCDSLNDPDEKHPNTNICPICMAHPGTLPVINAEAIRKVMMAGLALHCSIERDTFFERKNYFYPDLPKGYQISQFQKPLCREGYLEANGKRFRIERIHLEEDTARSQHVAGQDYTLIDFNRAGVPLMELVTHPDLETAEDVWAFAEELRLTLRYLGVSDADMEKGQMRVEVNISLRPKLSIFNLQFSKKLGTKVEVKNINSINAASRAVTYEVRRQTELLEAGEKVVQETRGWDDVRGATVSQRIKEGSADYRYFPEPDLPPLHFDDAEIEGVRVALPELPWQRRERFGREYGLPAHDIEVFTADRALGDWFEEVASELAAWDKLEHLKRPEPEHQGKLIKLASNYIMTELSRMLDEASAEPQDTKISPEHFAELMVRLYHGEISSSAGQAVLKEMFATGLGPEQIIREKDLAQVSDAGALESAIAQAIADNPKAVEDYRKGKEASLKFLVGKVMSASKGKANPQVVAEILQKKLQ